jgi:hypothetical protein
MQSIAGKSSLATPDSSPCRRGITDLDYLP